MLRRRLAWCASTTVVPVPLPVIVREVPLSPVADSAPFDSEIGVLLVEAAKVIVKVPPAALNASIAERSVTWPAPRVESQVPLPALCSSVMALTTQLVGGLAVSDCLVRLMSHL